MSLVRGIARHRATTLHALLVLGHRRHTVGKLQAQQSDQRYNDEQSIAHCPILTLGGLDAGVNERIQTGFCKAGACGSYPKRLRRQKQDSAAKEIRVPSGVMPVSYVLVGNLTMQCNPIPINSMQG